jgi:glycosyltransferase involved in cell wall biosynthesis
VTPPPAPRVLMTADAVGGVWTYALDLARGLARTGVVVTLVVFGPSPSPDQVRAAHAIPGLSLIDNGLPLDWMAAEQAEILECGAALRGLARANRADVIHLNSPALAAIGSFSAPVIGACHSCLATWWAGVREGPMPPDFRWRSRALWRGMLACNALVAPTAAFAQLSAHTYEVPVPFVVHNGRSPAAVAPAPCEPMVFTSGRLWDAGKNISVLDEAAALISAPLYAAGPLCGPNGEWKALGYAKPLGRLSSDDVAARLARAPVYASSALYEPFGLGVLEAAQAGCALVLSDIATFRELWDGAAVFVDPRDAPGFARAMDRLLADPAEAAALAAQARTRAARYSVAAMTAGALAIYRMFDPARFHAPLEEAAA